MDDGQKLSKVDKRLALKRNATATKSGGLAKRLGGGASASARTQRLSRGSGGETCEERWLRAGRREESIRPRRSRCAQIYSSAHAAGGRTGG